ncbi:hypothetical protein GCM10027265_31320 [Jatrophihabitans fulvus]
MREGVRVPTVDVDRFARLAARVVSAPGATVVLAGRGGDSGPRAVVGRHDDPSGPPAALTSAIGVRLGARVAREGVLCTHATHPDPEHGAGSWLGVPVVAGEGVAGAVCVLDPADREWTSDELEDVVAVAEALGRQLTDSQGGTSPSADRAELERRNAFLNAVLENLSEGVAACDADGTLVYFNPELRRIHGLPERPIPREEWASAYDLYDADGERLLTGGEIPLARAFNGEQVRRQQMVVVNERGRRHFVSSGDPLVGAGGERLGAVVLMHDVTHEHRRRRVRAGHLAVATELAQAPERAAGVATALTHLRAALEATTADLVGVREPVAPDVDRRVVAEVIRSGATVQRVLDDPYEGHVVCVPVAVDGTTTDVLYLAGPSDDLLDDLSATTWPGRTTTCGGWRA